jgi:uncharacterized membrane protein
MQGGWSMEQTFAIAALWVGLVLLATFLGTRRMMSTGLTFGKISALFGLSHGIVTREQYSHLVAVVIGSAVVPTLIAGAFFLPRHLLTPRVEAEVAAEAAAVAACRQTEQPEPIEEGWWRCP